VPGMKFDKNKTRLELLPFDALEQCADVFAFGAAKYGEWNWTGIEEGVQRYVGSLLRHVSRFQQGEEIDPDSGLHHLAHAGACCLIILRFLAEEGRLPTEKKDLSDVTNEFTPARDAYARDGEYDENAA